MGKIRTNQKNRPGFRHCSDCKTEFPIETFSRNKKDAQGRAHQCRACVAKRTNAHYHKNHDKMLAYQKGKRQDYIKRNISVVRDALVGAKCGKCGAGQPLQFIGKEQYHTFHDPVMSAAKRAKPLVEVEKAIKESTPVCIACVVP